MFYCKTIPSSGYTVVVQAQTLLYSKATLLLSIIRIKIIIPVIHAQIYE